MASDEQGLADFNYETKVADSSETWSYFNTPQQNFVPMSCIKYIF
jgi:hypothetical protein